MTFPQYPKYRDSGIEWLGDIPEGWSLLPLFTVLQERKEKNIGDKEDNVLSLSYGNIIRRNVEDNSGLLPESFETYQIVYPGNIILRLTDLQNDKRSLRTGLVKERGIITSAYVCLESTSKYQIDSNYSNYLLYSYDISKVFYSLGGGVRQSMKYVDLKWLEIPVPITAEQKAIASFLDQETQKIDTLISKKERQIELLQEKRSALISHVVTKGLNPDVKMKDSGIEWLGEIPEGWKTLPLKRVFNILNGSTPKSSEPDYWDGDIPWATPDDLGSVVGDTLNVTQRMITEAGYNSCGTTLAPSESLVLSTRAPIGYIAIAGKEMCTNQGCRCLVFKYNDNHKYYFYLVLSANEELQSFGQGSTFKELSRPKLENITLLKLPNDEQVAIAFFLDRETKKIDILTEKIKFSIEKLREYRTAIISAAVTGKIDVRKEVA